MRAFVKFAAPACFALRTEDPPRLRWTVAELSLALVLLIGAGLLIKSFYRLLAVDPGFAPERVLTMNINLTDSRYPRPAQKRAFFSEALRRAESLPGVRSSASRPDSRSGGCA